MLQERQSKNSLVLLKPQQVADLLGVNKNTLAAWRCVRRYPLPFVRVGRLIMYRLADVEAFIEARTEGIEK